MGKFAFRSKMLHQLNKQISGTCSKAHQERLYIGNCCGPGPVSHSVKFFRNEDSRKQKGILMALNEHTVRYQNSILLWSTVQPKYRSNNNFLYKPRSVWVPSDNPEYLTSLHLSSPVRVDYQNFCRIWKLFRMKIYPKRD